MTLQKYLNKNSSTNYLRRFAFLGPREVLDRMLLELTEIAEPEQWYFSETNGESMSIIFYFIVHTFDQLYKQNKILVNEDETAAVANTGLLTPQGEQIFFHFEKSNSHVEDSPSSNYWKMKKFITEGSRTFAHLNIDSPEVATYFDDFNQLYFDPSIPISLSFEHIFGERNERLPEDFKIMPIDHARLVFNGFLDHTVKRIQRNNRIPVPQFYRDKIMFLIPVKILANKTVIIAVEKINNQYIGNTTLTKNMAYNCARLLNKPESNWLLVD